MIILNTGYSDPTSRNEFSLTINITGELDQKIYLSKRDAGKWVNIDSSSIATGKILMNSRIQEAEMFYLRSGRDLASIFMEPSEIMFTAHADSINKGTISGSKTQAEFDSFNESISSITNQLDTLFTQYRAAAENNDQPALEELNNLIDAKDGERLARTKDYAYTKQGKRSDEFLFIDI